MRNLIILTGPTAVGKTDLSVKLAQTIGGEIISADSMQIYKGMDIGSAKVTQSEMQDIKHYLIDVLEPTDNFDITKFKELATEAINSVYSRGKIPIICGGTGFYIQALLYDVNFTSENPESKVIIRKELEEFLSDNGNEALHNMLKDIDPISYEMIPVNNTKRVIRAIEFYKLNNYPISIHNEEQRAKESSYNYAYFVLNDDREKLYHRIDLRVEKMIASGLLDEVKQLKQLGVSKNNTSYNGIGYREIFEYLEGCSSINDAIEKIKQNSRHYAKRQLTWFRREKDVVWLNRQELINDEMIIDKILDVCRKKEII